MSRPSFFVLTGFLGSGKTTLLHTLLSEPGCERTAVLINELGEVGLDHHLLERMDQDVSLLPAGCVCCVVGGELQAALARVLDLHPTRIVLETTGIADPGPVLHALATSSLADRYAFAGVITTLDASRGAEVIDSQPEGRLQLELADRVVLTKTDLASSASMEGLSSLLADYPDLEVVRDPRAAFAPLRARVGAAVHPSHRARVAHHAQTQVLEFNSPVDAQALWQWLRMVTMLDGPGLLRIKGIVESAEGPVVLQSAQRTISPPRLLAEMPEGWLGSRLVVISRGLSPQVLAAMAEAAQAAAKGEAMR